MYTRIETLKMNPNQYVHLTGKAEKDFSGDTVEFPTTEKIKYAYSKNYAV